MSGRRAWGGYGVALGLAIVVGCAQREARPPAPEEPEAAAATAEAAPPAETSAVEKSTAAPAAAGEPSLHLKGIKLVEDEGQTGLFIKLSRTPDKIEQLKLTNPNRLVFDLYGPVSPDLAPIERAPVADPLVSRVRAGKEDGRLRVTIVMKGAMPKVTVNELQGMVVAFFGERTGAATATKSQVLYAEGGAPAVTETVTETATAPAPAVEMATVEPPAPETKVTQTVTTTTVTRVYTGQKISLDFKDADILNVLRILAEVGGVNIIATDDVKGRVTVRLVDVPWDQALDIILQANRLDKIVVGNVWRVSTVTRIKEEREAQLAADQAAKELEPLKTAYIHVNYLKVTGKELPPTAQNVTLGTQQVCLNTAQQQQTDLGDKIVDEIKDVLSERGKVRVDARSNTIIVRDIQRGIDAAIDLIAKLDVPTPEVLIESNIVEATDSFTRDLGIQWGYNYAAAPQFGNATGKQFPSSIVIGGGTGGGSVASPNVGLVPGTGPASSPGAGFNTGPTIGPSLPGVSGASGLPGVGIPFIADFPATSVAQGAGSSIDLALGSIDGSKGLDARITALEREGKAKVISRPKVTTANNQNACIASVRIDRVRLPSAGTIIGAAAAQNVAFQEFFTGIVLHVVPQVSADGFVLLQLKVVSSTSLGPQPPDSIPASNDREASTTVLIKAGETLVLGGVFRDNSTNNETGIPWLRSIPGIGWLFKDMLRNSTREELLVFLTPRLVQGSGARIAGLPTARDLWEHRATQ